MPVLLNDTQVFAGRLKDRKELEESSSGGAFTALSNWAFKNEYAVVCSSYDYTRHSQNFSFVYDAEQRNRARGSKYVQADSNIPYHEIEKWIKSNKGKKLLFIGMGCQAAAVAKYAELKGIRDNILVVDIICHGGASPRIWREYIKNEEAEKGKVHYINFKDKRNGWERPVAIARTDTQEFELTKYINMYYGGDILRPSCHKCPFTTPERTTDITIGDFWGIKNSNPKFYDSLGTSLFLIHTQEGKKLFKEIRIEMDWIQSNLQDCQQPNLQYPTQSNPDRQSYWKDYHKYGIKYVTEKYGNPNAIQKIFRKIKKLKINIQKGKRGRYDP